ncbi:MAG: 1-deoxy-D-xylulose-5-phosphate synthase, partial [Muribaculaceae bacterium]|nr:1-deoxy-D-xylulose-5-phosphate synthase [Muribaculaceae bacterium]
GELLRSKGPRPPKYQDVFGKTLVELAEADSRVVGITAAMPSGTSISELQAVYPQRTFDVGISEGHAVTFAGGLAKSGMRPFVAIYSSFLQRAYDQIIHDVAIASLPVVLCIDRAGLVGEDGVTHHGVYDMSYLNPIPGITIASPSDEMTLRNLMFTALHHQDGPFAIRYPRGEGRNVEWHSEMQEQPVGRGRVLAEGDDVAILTIGPIASEAAKAVEMLAGRGIKAAHYDMIYLKPIDGALIEKAARKNCLIVTVEDGTVNGGLGSTVRQWLDDNGMSRKLVNVGVPDRFVAQGTPAELYRQCGMDAGSIHDIIVSSL